jgi:ESS family glutamate:Na+ symporter
MTIEFQGSNVKKNDAENDAALMRVIHVHAPLAMLCVAPAIAAGRALHARSELLRKCLIPSPMVSGFLLMLGTLVLRLAGWALDVDPVLQYVSMVTFFTSIGFNLDRDAVRRGGGPAGVILGMFTLGALVQNGVGVAVARWLGLHPLLGVAAGAVALAGGPATSLAFGPTLEQAGALGATSVALAAAMVGILVAGVTTGAFGAFLVRRDGLRSQEKPVVEGPLGPVTATPAGFSRLARTLALFAAAMGLGHFVTLALDRGLHRHSVSLPAYVGAMIVAAGIRAAANRFPALLVPRELNDAVGATALTWFIPLALWTLRFWELPALAGSIVLILMAQLPVTVLLAWTTYRLIGRSYDSALMASGYFGFMYGTMANSLAGMEELSERFGYSRQAFLVISLGGGVVSDLLNVAAITLSRAGIAAWMR